MQEFDQSKIEAILQTLEPKQGAILKFLLHLYDLEKQSKDPLKPQTTLDFEYGAKLQTIIQNALDGNLHGLPIPNNENYGAFGWHIKDPGSGKTKGSMDMRIYDFKVGKDKPALRFFSNQGSLNGMEKDWADALDKINFPCVVEDRGGFHFENTASKVQAPTPKI